MVSSKSMDINRSQRIFARKISKYFLKFHAVGTDIKIVIQVPSRLGRFRLRPLGIDRVVKVISFRKDKLYLPSFLVHVVPSK